jgi:hypothetical protein
MKKVILLLLLLLLLLLRYKLDELSVEIIMPLSIYETEWRKTLPEMLVVSHLNKRCPAFY